MRRLSRRLLAVLVAAIVLARCTRSGTDAEGERFLYLCDLRQPGVLSFRVDAATGVPELAVVSTLRLATTPQRLAITASGRFAYGLSGRLVLAYSLSAGGGVTPIAAVNAVRRTATKIVLSPTGERLYTLDPAAGIAAYAIDAGGALSPVGAALSVGKEHLDFAFEPAGRALHVLARPEPYGAGPLVQALDVDPASGALSRSRPPLVVGHHAALVRIHPSGRFGAVVQGGYDGKLDVYAIDAATGALAPVPSSPFGSGAEPRMAEFHPSGRFLYVLAGSALWAYALDSAGGLSRLPGSPFEMGMTPWHVAIDPAGRFLYATETKSPGGLLGVYALHAELGTPVPVDGSPFSGKGPQSLALRPGPALELASLPSPAAEPAAAATPGPADAFGLAAAAVPELVASLSDPDWRVRYAAVLQLGSKGPEAEPAVPALVSLLQSDVLALRQAAATALNRIGTREAMVAVAAATTRPSLVAGADDVPSLVAALDSADRETRKAAARALRRFGANGEPAVPKLAALLDDDSPDVRRVAAEALGSIGPAAGASVPALYGALVDDVATVREAAARAIRSIRRSGRLSSASW